MKTETSVDSLTNASTLDDRDTALHTKIVVHALGYTVFDADSQKLRNTLVDVITEALINCLLTLLQKHWVT